MSSLLFHTTKMKLFCSTRWHLSYCCLLWNSQSSSLQCFLLHEYQKQNKKDEMSTFCARGRKVANDWWLLLDMLELIHDKWSPLNVTNYILLWTWLGFGKIDKKWTVYSIHLRPQIGVIYCYFYRCGTFLSLFALQFSPCIANHVDRASGRGKAINQ